jgi:outer membrane protein
MNATLKTATLGVAVASALAIGLASAPPANAQPTPPPTPAAAVSPLPLSLQDALTLALTNNLAYQAAAQDVKAAQARLIQARGNLFPSVSAGYSYVHTQNAAFFFIPVPQPTGPPVLQKSLFSATNMNNVNATLQYALYSGGAVQAVVGQAAAGYSAAQSNYAAARATVITDVTSAYFNLILAQRTALISDQAVDVGNQNLRTSQELFNAGTAAKADVLRQQVSLANAQVAAVRAHNSADLANATLANLLNINLGSSINPTQPLEIHPPAYGLTDLLQGAQTRRPEIASAIDAMTIAERTVAEARAGTLPAINLQVSEASSKPNFVNVPQPQLSETLAVVWKLFDGGLTHGKVVEATAEVDKAKINLQQLRNSVDLQVRQAYFDYVAAQAAVGAANSAQVSAAESLRVTQLRYRSGIGTALDLSDSLLTFTQTQVQYATALADESRALVELQRAAGLL